MLATLRRTLEGLRGLRGEAVRRDPAAHRANMSAVIDWVAAGRLKPRIHATFPLEEISEAIKVLDRRQATGKVVLSI